MLYKLCDSILVFNLSPNLLKNFSLISYFSFVKTVGMDSLSSLNLNKIFFSWNLVYSETFFGYFGLKKKVLMLWFGQLLPGNKINVSSFRNHLFFQYEYYMYYI